MKRRLIIANTYYQLIVAIQMKCTVFAEDEIVLFLSNHSKNSERIFERIVKTGIFEENYYIKSKGVLQNVSIKNHFQDLYRLTSEVNNRFSYYLEGVRNKYFDEILIYNFGRDIIGLFSILYEYNNQVTISLFEEGILSYNFLLSETIGEKIIESIRKSKGKKSAIETIKSFYCFYPVFYKGDLKTVLIPNIKKNSKCESIIIDIFDIKSYENYKQKYIYFTSVYDFEGGEPVGELEIVKKIQEIVGKDNLLIKVHPRDDRNVYNQLLFNIDCNSDIPWEAIQLSLDFSDKVFLSATSGSVLAGSLLTDKPVKIYYLCNLCTFENNADAERSVQTIKRLINDDEMCKYFKNVRIIESLKELIDEETR